MKGNEGMEWHLHLNSTFHLLWAPKRFTNPAEQNHLRKILEMIKALLSLCTYSYNSTNTSHWLRVYTCIHWSRDKSISGPLWGVWGGSENVRQKKQQEFTERIWLSGLSTHSLPLLWISIHINLDTVNLKDLKTSPTCAEINSIARKLNGSLFDKQLVSSLSCFFPF